MGLFDRIRGRDDDEEIELQFQRQRWQNTSRNRKDPEDVEEVELQDTPRKRSRRSRRRNRSTSSAAGRRSRREQPDGGEDGSDDGFILPGMKPAADNGSDETESQESGSWRDEPDEDRLEAVLEQNERIIELLEEIAGVTSKDDDGGNPLKNSNMW